MQDDLSVHSPELPGVRTLKKDVHSEEKDTHVAGVELTVPEHIAPVTLSGKTANTKPQSGGAQLFDVERAFNNETVQEGTIVTDKKRKRMGTGEMLKSAFSEWWGNTQKNVESSITKLELLKPEVREEPKIETPEKRTNIIQEAAQLARQAPRDDHAIVLEKVRTFAHDSEVVGGKPVIKAPEPKAPAHWGPDTKASDTSKNIPRGQGSASVQTLDLRTSVIAPAVKTRSATSLPGFAVPKINVPADGARKTLDLRGQQMPLATAPVLKPRQTEKPLLQKKDATWSFYNEAPREHVDMREKVSEVLPKPIKVERPVVVTPPTPPVERRFDVPQESIPPPPEPISVPEAKLSIEEEAPREERENTNYEESAPATPPPEEQTSGRDSIFLRIPRPILLGGIVLIGSVFGITSAFMSIDTDEKEVSNDVSTLLTTPSFLSIDSKESLPLPGERDALLNALSAEVDQKDNNGVSYIALTKGDGDSTLAPTVEVLGVLKPRMDDSFMRALNSEHMFGSVNGNMRAPYLILRATNFDVAFAGMLSWEKTMSADLAPLFGTPVTDTLAPHTTGSSTAAHFVDAIKANRSIRILYDELGNENILYAFVHKEFIVITTTGEALTTLVEHFNKK